MDLAIFDVRPVKKENVSIASFKIAVTALPRKVNVSVYHAIRSSKESSVWIYLNHFDCLLMIKKEIALNKPRLRLHFVKHFRPS